MNKTKWSRVTVVLDKKTGDEIRYVSAVTGAPVSEIVRDVISAPVAHLAGTLQALRADPTPEALQRLKDSCTEMVDQAHADYHRRVG